MKRTQKILTEKEMKARLKEKPMYLTVSDIYEVMPVGRNQAQAIAEEIIKKMKEQNMYIPKSHTIMVSKKIFCEYLGI